jgi:O-antigen ligase
MPRAIHEAHVLSAAALLAPILALYAPRALAALLVVAAVAGALARGLAGRGWPVPRGLTAGIFAVALVWALASVAWGIEAKGLALQGILRLTLVTVSGLVLLRIVGELGAGEGRAIGRWLVVGVLVALALLAVERASDASIRRLWPLSPVFEGRDYIMGVFNRGISVLALLSFPAAYVLLRRDFRLAFLLWCVAFVLALLLTSGAAQLAFAIGAAAAACAWLAPRRVAVGFGAVIAAVVLLMPPLALLVPPPDKMPTAWQMPISFSGHHRLQIWRFTADRVVERPLVGWGYDSSRHIPGNTAYVGFSEPALPLHPHNAPLQWWLELGLPGALLGAALLLVIALAIRRRAADRMAAAACIGQLACGFTLASLSFGTWQGWWVAALFLAAAFTAAVVDFRLDRPERAAY